MSLLHTFGFGLTIIGFNDSASGRGTRKNKSYQLSGEEIPGLVSCGEAEVAASEMY